MYFRQVCNLCEDGLCIVSVANNNNKTSAICHHFPNHPLFVLSNIITIFTNLGVPSY